MRLWMVLCLLQVCGCVHGRIWPILPDNLSSWYIPFLKFTMYRLTCAYLSTTPSPKLRWVPAEQLSPNCCWLSTILRNLVTISCGCSLSTVWLVLLISSVFSVGLVNVVECKLTREGWVDNGIGLLDGKLNQLVSERLLWRPRLELLERLCLIWAVQPPAQPYRVRLSTNSSGRDVDDIAGKDWAQTGRLTPRLQCERD